MEEELSCSTKNAPCMLICTLYEKPTIHVANSILSLNNECQFNPVVLQLDKAIVFRSTRSIPPFLYCCRSALVYIFRGCGSIEKEGSIDRLV